MIAATDNNKRNGVIPAVLDASWVSVMVLLVAAFVLRISTFGDPNLHVDETFYFLVGQRMHDGVLPYVGVWDRKPLGLFIIYYLIAGLSRSVLSYQIVAALFAAATAVVINLIASRLAGRQGGILAGLTYLLMLGPLLGYGGQAPVFYNLFIAAAALLIVQERERLSNGVVGWRVMGAMALCGLAITIKQTTLFESALFGAYLIVALVSAKAPPRRILGAAAGFCLIGALPMLMIAGCYWSIGHWFEFWHAMITSNLAKAPPSTDMLGLKVLEIGLRLLPVILVAGLGLLSSYNQSRFKVFLSLWIAVSLIGCMFIPNFVLHYFLPFLLPLSIASGWVFDRHHIGILAFGLVAACAVLWYNPFNRWWTLQSIRSMDMMAQTIKEHDRGRGLLVFDGPPYLYAMTGKSFMTPLSFPYHLNFMNENNVSHIDTDSEIDRILRARPESIVIAVQPRNIPANLYSWTHIRLYIRSHCHFARTFTVYEAMRTDSIAIYSDCV